MRVRRVTHLALTLLVAAGLGVCVASAQKKSTPSKSPSTAHRSKSSKNSKRRERGQKTPTPDRISASACERRFVHRKTEREVGRVNDRSDEKIPGSAWAESYREAGCENTTAIGPGLSNRGCCPTHASDELFFSAENAIPSDGPPPAVVRHCILSTTDLEDGRCSACMGGPKR